MGVQELGSSCMTGRINEGNSILDSEAGSHGGTDPAGVCMCHLHSCSAMSGTRAGKPNTGNHRDEPRNASHAAPAADCRARLAPPDVRWWPDASRTGGACMAKSLQDQV